MASFKMIGPCCITVHQEGCSIVRSKLTVLWLGQGGFGLAFEMRPDNPSLAGLFDHIVQGQALLPAAAFLEMAASASCSLLALSPTTHAAVSPPTAPTAVLTAVVIAAPLVLSSASSERQVIRCKADSADGSCEISSTDEVSGRKTTHFRSGFAAVAAAAEALTEAAAFTDGSAMPSSPLR